jgi:hypothetical protein
MSVRTGRLAGVGDQVCEYLAKLSGEAIDVHGMGEALFDLDALVAHLAIQQQQHAADQLLEIHLHRHGGFAVEAEHGAADLQGSAQLLLSEFQVLVAAMRIVLLGDEEVQVRHRVQRVVDLVRDACRQAAGDRQLFIRDEGDLRFAQLCDVTKDDHRAVRASIRIHNR